jgi:pyruvate/2-oxoglutarate dehydrogenase complex dihydrolipoamide acyltransferase (E2) component
LEEEVLLPQWGMGMSEGTVIRWFKQKGDSVEEGEPLVEIEGAKVTDTVSAPVTGTVKEIRVEEEETVPVGHVLAIIDRSGVA